MKAKNRVKTYYSQAMAAEAFDLMYEVLNADRYATIQ